MFKKIMVALDGSQKSEEGIPLAIELSEKFSAEIVLFKVIEPYPLMKKDRQAEEKVLREKAVEYLNSIKSKVRGKGIETSIVVKVGDPGSEICEYANKESIDMIVIGIVSRSRVEKLLLGSTAQFVLLRSLCPVLSKLSAHEGSP